MTPALIGLFLCCNQLLLILIRPVIGTFMLMSVGPMLAMHEQVHQRASQEQQKWQDNCQVLLMFDDEIPRNQNGTRQDYPALPR